MAWNSLMEEETSPPSISKQEKPPTVFIQTPVFLFGRKLKDKSKQKSPNVNITEWEGPHNFGKNQKESAILTNSEK